MRAFLLDLDILLGIFFKQVHKESSRMLVVFLFLFFFDLRLFYQMRKKLARENARSLLYDLSKCGLI